MTVSVLAIVFPAVLAAAVGIVGFMVANRRATADRKHNSEEAERDRQAHAEQARLDQAVTLERLNAEHRHQRELVAETRRQERITDTYLLMLDTLGTWSAWMAALDETTVGKSHGMPEHDADGQSLSARVTAFASAAVSGQFTSVRTQITEIGACAKRVDDVLADASLSPDVQERTHGTTFTREMRRLDKLRRDAYQAIRELQETIRSDLGNGGSSEVPTPSRD